MVPDVPWQLTKTDNPDEWSFVTRHDQEAMSKLRPNDFPKRGVTLYRDFKLRIPSKVNGPGGEVLYGNYIYADSIESGDAQVTFLWVKVKTAEEIATPFDTEEIQVPHGWKSILEWIDFGQETGLPFSQSGINSAGQQAIFQAPRWVVRYGYRPGDTYMTKATVRKFLSHIPFPDYATESDEPHASEVSWDLGPTSHGTIGECLHDDVEIPKSGGGIRSVSSAGNLESSSNTAASGQNFPRTNHITWQDHTVNEVKYQNGQYLRVETTWHAPYMPPITEKTD